MKKVLLILTLVFVANVNAQTEYENGMNKAFELWGIQKNSGSGLKQLKWLY